MADYVYRLNTYNTRIDHANLKKHLEKMALKGLFLVDAGSLLWKYEKRTPDNVCYGLIYSKNIIRKTGWEYVTSSDKLHIYISNENNVDPLTEDYLEQLKTIDHDYKKLKHTNYLIILTLLLSLYNQISDWYAIKWDLYQISIILVLLSLIISLLIDTIHYNLWYKKALEHAENYNIMLPSIKPRIIGIMQQIVPTVLLLIFLGSWETDSSIIEIISSWIGVIFIGVILLLAGKFANKTKSDVIRVLIIIATAIVVAVLVLIILIISVRT